MESIENVTQEEVLRAGYSFMLAVGICAGYGHASPSGMVDYVPRPEDDEIGALVWDAFAATRTDAAAREASERLHDFAQRRGLLRRIAAAVMI